MIEYFISLPASTSIRWCHRQRKEVHLSDDQRMIIFGLKLNTTIHFPSFLEAAILLFCSDARRSRTLPALAPSSAWFSSSPDFRLQFRLRRKYRLRPILVFARFSSSFSSSAAFSSSPHFRLRPNFVFNFVFGGIFVFARLLPSRKSASPCLPS